MRAPEGLPHAPHRPPPLPITARLQAIAMNSLAVKQQAMLDSQLLSMDTADLAACDMEEAAAEAAVRAATIPDDGCYWSQHEQAQPQGQGLEGGTTLQTVKSAPSTDMQASPFFLSCFCRLVPQSPPACVSVCLLAVAVQLLACTARQIDHLTCALAHTAGQCSNPALS